MVTELSDAGPFWEAEAEHQDYLQRYPNGYTCHFLRPDWKLPHRETAWQLSDGDGALIGRARVGRDFIARCGRG